MRRPVYVVSILLHNPDQTNSMHRNYVTTLCLFLVTLIVRSSTFEFRSNDIAGTTHNLSTVEAKVLFQTAPTNTLLWFDVCKPL